MEILVPLIFLAVAVLLGLLVKSFDAVVIGTMVAIALYFILNTPQNQVPATPPAENPRALHHVHTPSPPELNFGAGAPSVTHCAFEGGDANLTSVVSELQETLVAAPDLASYRTPTGLNFEDFTRAYQEWRDTRSTALVKRPAPNPLGLGGAC